MENPDAGLTPKCSALRDQWNERASEVQGEGGKAGLAAVMNEFTKRTNELLTLVMQFEVELRILRGQVVPDVDSAGRRVFRDLDRPGDPPKVLD